MKPYWDNGLVQLHHGDCRDVLAQMPVESVHCVVTSPPYWGLRDYGLEPSVWGGDAEHEHAWGKDAVRKSTGGLNSTTIGSGKGQGTSVGSIFEASQGRNCYCGAWLGTLGLEPTPELFVEHLVGIFRELRRVLRSDGTLWLNMGDSYAGSNRGVNADGTISAGPKQATNVGTTTGAIQKAPKLDGLKPKDLLLMPARVALALQADGWWLRSDIIWSKPNPMPESVTDRCTTAHEHVFLLAKSERYYYDAEAIREPADWARWGEQTIGKPYRGIKPIDMDSLDERRSNGRNKRTVWEIATEPYPDAHFATFPQALVEPCVLAGTSERGVCAECGAPWSRVVERSPMEIDRTNNHPPELRTRTSGTMTKPPESKTTGWRPTCSCNADTVPATVCDIFAGSGTVGVVAQKLGRCAVLIDASADYLALARRRIEAVSLPMKLEATL